MVAENGQEKQEISQINLTSVVLWLRNTKWTLAKVCESKIDLKTETNALLCQHKLTRNPCTERTAVIKK